MTDTQQLEFQTTTSPTIGEIAGALSKAQSAYKPVIKDQVARVVSRKPGVAPYEYRYADLAACLDAVREANAANGLAITQAPKVVGNRVTIKTLLLHTSGEWICGEVTLSSESDFPQAVGSAITYARRYGLSCVTGIASEQDDDGAAAGTGDNRDQGRQPPRDLAGAGTPAGKKPELTKVDELAHLLRSKVGVTTRGEADAVVSFLVPGLAFASLTTEQAAGVLQRIQEMVDAGTPHDKLLAAATKKGDDK